MSSTRIIYLYATPCPCALRLSSPSQVQSRCIIIEVLDVLYISLHSPCITIEVLDLQIRFLSKTYIVHLFLRVLFDDRLCVSVQIILYFFFIPAATRGKSS
ncbi:hypothetical protein SORBI_3001G230801 [Sorghum bicolor]|uniref:Uncharacterized protein n=1 Tax=Sorghum bicolor TaxID=4558 RepID=A0A1Z5S6Y1_SORBI|nr:hypothetical protein SORBI_3001G230801 [Sorghum bicolor]